MLPLTDSSILLPLGNQINPALNRRAHALAARLAEHPLEGVLETVPAYASLTVHYDPLLRTHAEVAEWLASHLAAETVTAPHPTRVVEIPVIYDGPDLAFVAEHCKLSIPEVIQLHSQAEYSVYMMGFLPGFPYLGGLPEKLHTPRRANPRTRIPAGSVAIAGAQAGIYPQESPGGWQLLGRMTIPLHDPQREPPFLLAPGDRVRFVTDKSWAEALSDNEGPQSKDDSLKEPISTKKPSFDYAKQKPLGSAHTVPASFGRTCTPFNLKPSNLQP